MTDPISEWQEQVRDAIAREVRMHQAYWQGALDVPEEDRDKPSAQQAIARATGSLVRGLVGEDEKPRGEESPWVVFHRNKVRAELREAATKLEGKAQ